MDTTKLELQPNDKINTAPIGLLSVEDGFNPREDLELNEEFVESVRLHGVLSPLLIRSNPMKAGHYTVVDGHRRYAAAIETKKEEVPVMQLRGEDGEADFDDANALIMAIVANEHRPLTSVEKAKTYKRLIDLGADEGEMVEVLGISERTLKETLRVLDSDLEELKEAIESDDPEKKIPTRVAARAIDLPKAEREELIPELKGKGTQAGLREVQAKEAQIGKKNRGRDPMTEAPRNIGFPWASDSKKRAQMLWDCIMETITKDPHNEAAHRHLEILFVLQGDREVIDLYPGNGRKPNVIAKLRKTTQLAKAHTEKQEAKTAKKAPAKKAEGRKRFTKAELAAKKASTKKTTKKKVSKRPTK